MEFEDYANGIKSLVNFDTFEKPLAEYKQVAQFTVKQGEMVKTTITKSKFPQLNDKRFYFPDGILSLPYGHQSLQEVDEFKKQKGQKIEKYSWQEKEKLFQMEKKSFKRNTKTSSVPSNFDTTSKNSQYETKNGFEPLNRAAIKKKHKRYYTLWNMDETKYSYNGKFEGNILIVGRTGCGKTTFVQNLGSNRLFGEINYVFWVSKIELYKEKEEKIDERFKDQEVSFHYPNNIDDFDYLIDIFKRRKSDYVNNDLGEKMILDKLIVMDGVSGLADKSNELANFLTVSRKYGLTCVYVFHIIYPGRQNWQMIMPQTQIFNFFPGSVHSTTITKTLSLFANRYKNTYIPTRNVWINKLYFEKFHSREKQCLTVDTRDVNDLGPGKLRTQADNGLQQICYYNRNKTDTSFNSFLTKTEQTFEKGEIKFSIVKVINNINKYNITYSEIGDELNNVKNDNIQSKLQQLSEGNIIRGTNYQDNNGTKNKRRKYTEHGRGSKKPRFLLG